MTENETTTSVENDINAPLKKVAVKKTAPVKASTKKAPPAPVKKATAKKVVTKVIVDKKASAKKAAKKAENPGEYGAERSHDLPWNDKKVALFRALKSLRATDGSSAVTAAAVVEKSGGTLSGRDVRHYAYHAKAGKLVDLAKLETGRGYGFYLTKAGAAIDPVKSLKDQTASKTE